MNNTTLSPDMLAATDALAEAIAQTPPLRAYHHARHTLETDTVASGLLNELMVAQAAARRHQMNGGLSSDAITQLRALQNQVQANLVIMAYVKTQQEAVAYLPAINEEISQLLGIDFAALSNVSTC